MIFLPTFAIIYNRCKIGKIGFHIWKGVKNMGKRTEEVKRMLEKHQKKQKQIERKTKDVTEKIEELGTKIGRFDLEIEKLENKLSTLSSLDEDKALREEYQEQIKKLENGYWDKSKSNIKIEKLQNELSETPSNDTDTIEKIQEQIEELKNGSEDVWIDGRNKCLEEKQELETQLKESETNREKERALKEEDERFRSNLAQGKREIDKDIETTELKIQRAEINCKLKYQEIKDFKYEYEEYEEKDDNGNTVIKTKVTNQGKLNRLNMDYEKLQDSIKEQKGLLKDLQEAKAMCEKELAIFKRKDEERAKKLGKAWNEAKKSEEVSKDAEKEQGNKGDRKEGKGKKEENGNKKEWHPDLTQEQIDEMKADGIEPGDPEYEAYLKNHGIEITKQEKKEEGKKEENGNKKEWHPDLTQEQIDEMKADGIEPGDPEYETYLKNHGIEITKQEKKEENGNKKEWHPDLTQEQIDELKAEGLQPGDPEYDMYLKNHAPSIKLEKQERKGKSDNKEGWHPDLTQEQIDELKAEGLQSGNPEYDMYLKNHGIELTNQEKGNNECSITIGRTGIVEYNGKKYEVSKKNIKRGLKANSFDDKTLEEYLKWEIGLKPEIREIISNFKKEGYIDMTVVQAIFSTDLNKDQQIEILYRHLNEIHYSEIHQKHEKGINITYDMDDLSKTSIWDRIRRKEVNNKEKAKISENAINAKIWGLGIIKGKYQPAMRTPKTRLGKFINRMVHKNLKSFPTELTNKEAETVATQYNEIAYDEKGNKVETKDLQKAWREKQRINIIKNKQNKLSPKEVREIGDLVKSQVNASKKVPEEEEYEEEEEL